MEPEPHALRPRASAPGFADTPPGPVCRRRPQGRKEGLPPEHRPARHRHPREMLARLKSFDRVQHRLRPVPGLARIHRSPRWSTTAASAWNSTPKRSSSPPAAARRCCSSSRPSPIPETTSLVFEPFYTNYNGFAGLVGVRTVPVTTRAEDGYHLPSRAEIESKITPRTRAIMICSRTTRPVPSTPTTNWRWSGDICRERGLYLVSDEVYREFTYDGLKHRSALTLEGLEEQVIVTDSLSKRVSCAALASAGSPPTIARCWEPCCAWGRPGLCPPTLGQLHRSRRSATSPRPTCEQVIAEYQSSTQPGLRRARRHAGSHRAPPRGRVLHVRPAARSTTPSRSASSC